MLRNARTFTTLNFLGLNETLFSPNSLTPTQPVAVADKVRFIHTRAGPMSAKLYGLSSLLLALDNFTSSIQHNTTSVHANKYIAYLKNTLVKYLPGTQNTESAQNPATRAQRKIITSYLMIT
jgi:hypothetical protein